SSRRRHTRCLSDWSSDVCSSDLGAAQISDWLIVSGGRELVAAKLITKRRAIRDVVQLHEDSEPLVRTEREVPRHASVEVDERKEIGRASCRERGEVWGGERGCGR